MVQDGSKLSWILWVLVNINYFIVVPPHVTTLKMAGPLLDTLLQACINYNSSLMEVASMIFLHTIYVTGFEKSHLQCTIING